MPLPALLAAAIAGGAIPAFSNILGGIIQRRQSIADRNYNSPINQVKRLNDAGLPMAALTGGVAAQQPAETNDLGMGKAGEGFHNFVKTKMDMKALELLEEQIATQKMTTQKVGAEATGLMLSNNINQSDPETTNPVAWQARMKQFEYLKAKADNVIKNNEAKMSTIDKEVKESLHKTGTITGKARAELRNMINQIDLGKQAISRGDVMNTLINELKKGGVSTAEAFLHSIISGGIGIGPVNK